VELRVPLAIVGNGGAAAEAALALRAHGYDGDIHLFSENRRAPYNPMLGPYIVSGAIPVEQAFPFGDEHGFYGANRVAAHLGKPVIALDALEQVLNTSDGSSYRYDRCLVASGARPSLPPVPGLREALADPRGALDRREQPPDGSSAQLDAPRGRRRVFTMRTLDDALDLKNAVDRLRTRPGEPARAAVIGASLVGVKVAAALRDLGLRVCLIEREPSILPLSTDPECAPLMQTHLLEEGYELRLGAVLASIDAGGVAGTAHAPVRLDFGALPGAADPSGAGGTACEDGASHEDVDLVVVCTGTRPSLGFLTPGQVDTGEGILVDEQLRSSIPTLYAAGDVAQGKNLMSGRHEIIGLWTSARYQGRAAGRSLAGAPSEYRGNVPHSITHVGRMLFASVGCLKEYDHVTVCRDGNTLQVRVWQEGRLMGVNLLNCCLSAGAVKHALLKAATGAATETEVTWTSFSE
jgi:NADPH-dependent 2,4-dienoyl-CoA reductase/sulfur reductase-like enzyme